MSLWLVLAAEALPSLEGLYGAGSWVTSSCFSVCSFLFLWSGSHHGMPPAQQTWHTVPAVFCLALGSCLINAHGSQGSGRGGSKEAQRQPKGCLSAPNPPPHPQYSDGVSALPLLSAVPLLFIFKVTGYIRFDLVYKHVQQGAGGRPLESAPGPRHCPVSQIRRPGAKSCIIRVALQW